MASQRLPGKALALLPDGRPLLWHVVTRVRQARTLDEVVVATGDDPANVRIVALCKSEGWSCHVGPERDVLARFHQAAKWWQADVIVRITGDCPLIDPHLIDLCVEARCRSAFGYLTNTLPPTFPDGEDIEVFTSEVLHRTCRQATLPSQREHVTPLMRTATLGIEVGNLMHEPDLSQYRLCVDEQADLDALRRIMTIAGADCDWRQALDVLRAHPEIAALNAHLTRNEGYAHSLKEEQG